MALSDLGVKLPPDELNRRLKQADGFTHRGWLIWNAVSVVTDGRVAVDVPARPTHAAIDEALSNRRPVLARLLLRGNVVHWVLIVGKDGQEYLVKDPTGRGRSLDRLSRYHSRIHAVRIFRNTP
jgi:hypothetical protein